MPLPKTMPALADLTQDIAGPLPLDLLRQWAMHEQDVERAADLLSAFRIEGTVVATDAAGLSALTEELDLLDVLALVSEPKETIHAVGTAVGGRAIGTWVADNTEMFYDARIAVATVVAAAAETQVRLAAAHTVGIGMCVHHGVFYEIGGGLYGRDADLVESAAEHSAAAGEILVTAAVADRLDRTAFGGPALCPAARAGAGGRLFAMAARPRMPDLAAIDTAYPHPYPPDFMALLNRGAAAGPDPEARREIYARLLHRCAVVFFAVAREGLDGSLETLLDDLVTNAVLDAVIRSTPGLEPHIAGVGGGLAILTFDTPQEALDCALICRARFTQNAIPVKTGVDIGAVLRFPNARGRSGISGEPVNVASKICEDAGAPARINITSRAAAQLTAMPPASNPFEIQVSSRTIRGIFL